MRMNTAKAMAHTLTLSARNDNQNWLPTQIKFPSRVSNTQPRGEGGDGTTKTNRY